jgi:hypothetical protein
MIQDQAGVEPKSITELIHRIDISTQNITPTSCLQKYLAEYYCKEGVKAKPEKRVGTSGKTISKYQWRGVKDDNCDLAKKNFQSRVRYNQLYGGQLISTAQSFKQQKVLHNGEKPNYPHKSIFDRQYNNK